MRSVPGILMDSGIDLTAWRLNEATGVSADGTTIVGNGVYDGHPAGWLAVIVIPEPSASFMLATGIGALMMLSKVRR